MGLNFSLHRLNGKVWFATLEGSRRMLHADLESYLEEKGGDARSVPGDCIGLREPTMAPDEKLPLRFELAQSISLLSAPECGRIPGSLTMLPMPHSVVY